ncbi:MAG: HDOD domain-containing protein [Gammaproteobacteria bacterium]|nr:HDOD domain-containing protein [Gammaproteobacteria bacterium]
MKSEITQLFDQIDNVPQVPEVVRTLLSQVNDPDIDFVAIAKNVEKEQIIAIKILHLANSAYYGLPRKIGSINQALVILGMTELKKLIIATGLINTIPDIPNFNLEDFWIDNFRTATYAKWIADKAKLQDSDMIFTAGLINGLGNILIHLGNTAAADEISYLIEEGMSRLKAEQQELGFSNQEACAELCRLWLFSDDLTTTVEQSGEPLNFDQPYLPSCAISIARYISESNYSEKTMPEKLVEFPREEWVKLDLKEEDIEDSMAEILTLETGLEGLLD